MLFGQQQVQAGKNGFGVLFLATLGSGAIGYVYNGKFDPNTYLTNIQEKKVNVLCCTPTEYRIMAKVEDLADYDLSISA